jgi:type II secretion system protein H
MVSLPGTGIELIPCMRSESLHHHPTFSFSSGYSLIEILVVLAILAIMGGLASVSFEGQLVQYRLHHAVRSLVTDLRGARQLAITEGRPVRLLLDLEQDRYRIELLAEADIPVNGIRDLRDRRQGFGEIDLSGSTGGEEIVFQSNGTTTNWTTITLKNGRGSEKRISVILTGRVKVL